MNTVEGDAEFVVVANRLPIEPVYEDMNPDLGIIGWRTSPGGLVIANPIGQIWSGAMMLDYLGEKEAADNIIKAIEKTLSNEESRTKDLKGKSNTKQCADAVLNNL